ncbi:MAG: glycosyltransferase [bacterium]
MTHRINNKSRKQILQVVDGFRMGGAENKLLELIERLDCNKYKVMLANVGPGGPLQSQFEELGIEIFNFSRKWAFDPKPFYQLYQLMRERRIDVVQTTLFWADFIGTLAAKCAGVRLIVSWETVSHSGDPYHNNFQRRNGYRLMAKLSNLIVAVSHEVKYSLIRHRRINPSKIRVIHYGVDLDKFHPNGNQKRISKRKAMNITADSVLIGIVARLEPWKGHSVFIEAFAEVAPRFSNAHVVFIGDGSLRAKLESMVKDYGLQSRIQFLGIRKDIADLLHCIDLFVLSSLPGEGLPNVLLEAMACKKSVIATSVGGVPELVRDGINGHIVPASNKKALGWALEKMLGDNAHLQLLGKMALTTVQREFSLKNQISAFEEIFDQSHPI